MKEKMEMSEMNECEISATMHELVQERLNDERNRRRVELRERLNAAFAAIGEDIYEDDDVLRFRRVMSGSVYTYAAIKDGGRWCVTGRRLGAALTGVTWNDLCEFIATGLVQYPDGTTLPQLLTAGSLDARHAYPSPLITPNRDVELDMLFVDES